VTISTKIVEVPFEQRPCRIRRFGAVKTPKLGIAVNSRRAGEAASAPTRPFFDLTAVLAGQAKRRRKSDVSCLRFPSVKPRCPLEQYRIKLNRIAIQLR
jgi:hypothetical protein